MYESMTIPGKDGKRVYFVSTSRRMMPILALTSIDAEKIVAKWLMIGEYITNTRETIDVIV